MNKWNPETLGLAGALVLVVAIGGFALAAAGFSDSILGALGLVAAVASLSTILLARLHYVNTTRTVARRMLRACESRYQHLVEGAHEGIWMVDPAAGTTYANARLATMFGYTTEQLAGRPLHDFLGINPPAALAALFAPGGDAGHTHDLGYLRRDGSTGWAIVSARTMNAENGAPAATLLMLTDITQRKEAELELSAVKTGLEVRVRMRTEELIQANHQLRAEIAVREAAEQALELSEKRLQDIITTLPVALLIKDPQSRITLMNKAAETGWGISFDEVAGKTGSELFTPDQMKKILEGDRATFEGGELVVEERAIWNVDRVQCFTYDSYKKPIYDARGKPLYMICVFVDITERKHAEAALQLSYQQLRQVTARLELLKAEDGKRIAQGIHDDLGQNLLALKLDVQMLHSRAGERHPLLQQRVGHVLATIDATIRSVREIMNDLHPSTLELGLPVALEWLVDQFEKRSGITCTLTVIGEHGPLPDTRRTSVIFRIVQESLLYVLRHAQATMADVTLAVGAGQISITIVDDGIGIVDGEAGVEAAFALRGIRERVDVFGGELEIDSGDEMGTTLSILIPTAATAYA
ncbi:MAG: PAS domain-containing sensor histidine kinase [Telluria sp.]